MIEMIASFTASAASDARPTSRSTEAATLYIASR
jgi:hypothetical protein